MTQHGLLCACILLLEPERSKSILVSISKSTSKLEWRIQPWFEQYVHTIGLVVAKLVTWQWRSQVVAKGANSPPFFFWNLSSLDWNLYYTQQFRSQL